MSLNCSRYTKQRYIWTSLLLATIVGSGILIYTSYIHRGTTKASCLKCKDSYVNPPEKLTQENCQPTCTTKECVLTASSLLKNMNTSADPCENFYSFMCGNLLENIGEEETYSIFGEMDRSIKLEIKSLLENLKQPYDELSGKVKTVYDSCMSYHASEVNAVPSALEFLRDAGIQGWPHLDDNFRFTNISMEESVGKMISYMGFFFLLFYPTNDEKHSKDGLYNLTVDRTSSLMYDQERRSKYEKTVFRILDYFEIGNQKARRIWEDFESIHEFLHSPLVPADFDLETTLGYSCKENKNTTLCDILKYVVKYTNNTGRFSTDFLYVNFPLKTHKIVSGLEKLSHWSVAHYLALRFFIKHLQEMNTAFQLMYLDIEELNDPVGATKYRPKFSIEKWENCIHWLVIQMPIPLSKVYLLNKNYTAKMEEIQSIFLTVREVASDLFNQQQWMEDTKREELKNIVGNLTNDFEAFTIDALKTGSSYLEQFHPTNESFLLNSLEYWNSYYQFLSSNLEHGYPLPFNPFQVNAYYDEIGVHFTFGTIRAPVYKHGLPKLLNLASFSPLIGHEFGHGVWNFFEKLNDSDATSVEYKKKKKCLQDQFSTVELKKIRQKVNANKTIIETLPDLFGFELSEKIINKYSEQEENANSTFALPALEFSPKQQLYIAMAQMWCETSNYKDALEQHEKDVHPLSEPRVTIMFRNLKGFSEAFMCPPGSNMNPADKCSFLEDPSV